MPVTDFTPVWSGYTISVPHLLWPPLTPAPPAIFDNWHIEQITIQGIAGIWWLDGPGFHGSVWQNEVCVLYYLSVRKPLVPFLRILRNPKSLVKQSVIEGGRRSSRICIYLTGDSGRSWGGSGPPSPDMLLLLCNTGASYTIQHKHMLQDMLPVLWECVLLSI